ncbi:hypothetical protein BGZ61DRAFT_136635 [Ilyonectria robusta]|uniref:uncharacterized protein n=1 Tax=Ilyonectria robusta TaxID=1079257 RepID=UPI001E8D15D7|nr:uncharacterized protein BGZ61DRAFT_136635 [Ilyonectria robusta]KAH8735185.1 hypothetical protein BGZ61DRAFT_136635 [Ilyonectria robusta]
MGLLLFLYVSLSKECQHLQPFLLWMSWIFGVGFCHSPSHFLFFASSYRCFIPRPDKNNVATEGSGATTARRENMTCGKVMERAYRCFGGTSISRSPLVAHQLAWRPRVSSSCFRAFASSRSRSSRCKIRSIVMEVLGVDSPQK